LIFPSFDGKMVRLNRANIQNFFPFVNRKAQIYSSGHLFSHFSTQSGIFRNSANAINQLATEVMFSYYENGEKPPHYAIRSHRHVHRTSGSNFKTEAIQTPAFQLATHYVRSGRNPNSLADIGMIVFKIDGDEVNQFVLKDRPSGVQSRKIWKV